MCKIGLIREQSMLCDLQMSCKDKNCIYNVISVITMMMMRESSANRGRDACSGMSVTYR